MKIKRYKLLLIALLVVGCYTYNINPLPYGGSKSDAVVKFKYQYDPLLLFESVHVNWSYADSVAKHKCQGWGFNNAEIFGGMKSEYDSNSGDNIYYVDYQCIY